LIRAAPQRYKIYVPALLNHTSTNHGRRRQSTILLGAVHSRAPRLREEEDLHQSSSSVHGLLFSADILSLQDEIASIAKKHSDFEHRINASGCSAADFTRYAQYEMNLETLYRKRAKRMGIRARMHHGTRRIFFILDRATRKFPGDVPLWLQYIEFARKEKASGVLAKALASALKLHPTKPEMWIYAARLAVEENADMSEARSHMQRGLRFCKKSKMIWKEYCKLEMVFVAKVFLRRAMLGIDAPKKTQDERDEDENMMRLPEITGEDSESVKKDKSLDAMALENVDTNPALNGALAIAIFDQAMKEIPNDLAFAREFYDLFTQFRQLRCCGRLLEHTVRYMLDIAAKNHTALWLGIQLPLFAVEITDSTFPGRLGTALSNMGTAVEETDNRGDLYLSFAKYFTDLLWDSPQLDPALQKVIISSLIKYLKQAEREGVAKAELYARWAELMSRKEKKEEALRIARRGLEKFPGDVGLSHFEQTAKNT
jgi:U3 small nucleolar RNA-associated protein 6